MTDSGFSSAASQRSTSSIIRPAHINAFSGSLKGDIFNLPQEKENAASDDASLPKPCMKFPSSFGRPLIPNRLIYGKNHGGYSPGLSPFCNQEMSPMSSLTYDFKELNTSQNSSVTPRKRLSLSSISSLDSPHPSNSSFGISSNASPAPSSIASSLDSPNPSCCDDGCGVACKDTDLRRVAMMKNAVPYRRGKGGFFAAQEEMRRGVVSKFRRLLTRQRFRPIEEEGFFPETPTPTEKSGLLGRSLQDTQSDDAENVVAEGEKAAQFRRYKSMPSAKARFRLMGVKEAVEDSEGDKENSSTGMRFTRHRSSGPNALSPIGLGHHFSPIGSSKVYPRCGSYNMMSSPLVGCFSHGTSSAFKPVSPDQAAVQHAKRCVLGDIDSNLPAQGLSPPLPTKSVGGTKRLLDDSASSSTTTVARKRKCSKSLNAKTAFLQDRKTKSADAIMKGRPMPDFDFSDVCTSPIAIRPIMYRPISAPILTGSDDDDYVLSHSNLCSHDSDEEEERKNNSDEEIASLSISSSYKDEDIEHMMCENVRGAANTSGAEADSPSFSLGAPTGLDGLISGPLLLSSGGLDANDSISALCAKPKKNNNGDVLRPRELFRSPSAPPLVPSRRALMKLKRGVRPDQSTESTPVSIKRPRTFASLPTADNSENTECAVDPCLNRSRSFNELDVMRAVDEGCDNPTLVGDFSRACTLPTVTGRKQDLKYITPETLADVIDEKHGVGMVEIVDCRYTYEYDGGHVDGAVNVWTEEQLIERFFRSDKPMWAVAKQQQRAAGPDAKPHVLVFHCEFSSERGPKLARFLRSYDRDQNVYPNLHYPEIYVLKDGYKAFYREKKSHCEPCNYVPMSHEAYASELRKFRAKSKTWAGERSKYGLYNRLKHQ